MRDVREEESVIEERSEGEHATNQPEDGTSDTSPPKSRKYNCDIDFSSSIVYTRPVWGTRVDNSVNT